MGADLTKAEKKAAREIIDKGLHREYVQAITEVEAAIAKWRDHEADTHDTYIAMNKTIREHNDLIARRYGNMSGSRYVYIIASQVIEGIIKPEELAPLSTAVRERILRMADL